MPTYESIELDVSRAGVAVVLLNRPEKRNAFNAEVIAELADVFELISKTPEVRLVLLRGAGKLFSAGADIDWMRAAADYTQHENEEDAYAMSSMLRRLHDLPQVTMALVHGGAMGGGIGLAAACDIVVAMKGASFSLSEVKLGIIAATISPYVTKAIGPRWAKALAITGETFDSDFAYQMGLAQYVVKDETEMEEIVEHLAKLVFTASPAAIAETKSLIDAVDGEPIDANLGRMVAKRLAHVRASPQGQEGLAAFLEKRKPAWIKP